MKCPAHLFRIVLANSSAFNCLSSKEASSSSSNGGMSLSIKLERAELIRCSRSSAIAIYRQLVSPEYYDACSK